ncbi:hypothetical protein [Streptomyces yanii]|uniref:Uncharacterized protein n=1 Tax=Streptomyces yanii TaxID=78510 RepID=A0ABV5RHH4_9ACTN
MPEGEALERYGSDVEPRDLLRQGADPAAVVVEDVRVREVDQERDLPAEGL